MPANGPVSLTRQTVYSVIPILDIIAFYKIKKLRLYLRIVYLGIALVAGSAYSMAVTPQAWLFSENYDPDFVWRPIDWLMQIPLIGITIATQIYLVRRWSRKWNMQFGSGT